MGQQGISNQYLHSVKKYFKAVLSASCPAEKIHICISRVPTDFDYMEK